MRKSILVLLLLPILASAATVKYYQNSAPSFWTNVVNGQEVFTPFNSNIIETPEVYFSADSMGTVSFSTIVPNCSKLGMLMHIEDNVRGNHQLAIMIDGIPRKFIRTDARGLLNPAPGVDSTYSYEWGGNDPLEFAVPVNPSDVGKKVQILMTQLYPTQMKVVKTLSYRRGSTKYVASLYHPRPRLWFHIFER